jgi:hypothetical protein
MLAGQPRGDDQADGHRRRSAVWPTSGAGRPARHAVPVLLRCRLRGVLQRVADLLGEDVTDLLARGEEELPPGIRQVLAARREGWSSSVSSVTASSEKYRAWTA